MRSGVSRLLATLLPNPPLEPMIDLGILEQLFE
jgi:hypothetical protein